MKIEFKSRIFFVKLFVSEIVERKYDGVEF